MQIVALTPHLHHLTGIDSEEHKHNEKLNKVMLFVMAIAIHNLPEGLAAVCTGVCGRNHAVCHQRRNDSRNP